jgi:hypothetical protein
MITYVTVFDGFVATKWWPMPFFWFCYEKGDSNNVVTFLYGGGVVEKAIFFLVVFSFLFFSFFLVFLV